MKKNNLYFYIYATVFITVAAVLSYGYYLYSNNWHSTSKRQCGNIKSSIQNLMPLIFQMDGCYRLGWSKKYYIQANKNVETGIPPMNLAIAESRRTINKVVIYVQGGPGAPNLGVPKNDDILWDIAEECHVAIIMPAYSGSFERSNYPNSSYEDAEREIGRLITNLSITGKVKISIFADSLGGNIISSRHVSIPAGHHFLNVPLIKSPKNAINYFNSKYVTFQERHNFNYTKQSYFIGNNSNKTVKFILEKDFIRAYFGNDEIYLNETFMDRWQKKQNVHPNAKFHAVIARDDHKAGGAEYAADLKKLGFSVEIVEGKHQRTEDDADRLDPALEKFKSQICAD